MRRLRYICGGEEGSVATGSAAASGGGEGESLVSAFFSDEPGKDDLGLTVGTEMPGGGAPLTIWSSLESDMVEEGHRLMSSHHLIKGTIISAAATILPIMTSPRSLRIGQSAEKERKHGCFGIGLLIRTLVAHHDANHV